ncbi:MAG TPA: DNA-directed DNA polymerase I, partial [Ignisphaera sp.]|nr:DNA-directed DNA polymerase I [Ignisphaera sp.]
NRAMQVYAFSNRYQEAKTLDSISHALLGIGKVKPSKPISELPLLELASYCYRDAYLTLNLTQFDNDLVMKLIILMMRIAKLPMEDIARAGISTWVKSMLYYEHRRRGYLIPNPEDILQIKGGAATRAVIKGKKYLGALVVDPPPGIFFNVTVVDFASLYPSMIKTWNLSYETVRCNHEECKSNKIPGTPHWVCRKRKGLSSAVIGFLRDFRIYVYKPLSKDKNADKAIRMQYDVVQRALKVFINASYGVFGADTFPLYCPPVAESTTALGRFAIYTTISKALEMGLAVLYGDTDSLFLWNSPDEKVRELLEWVSNTLHIDLEIDKKYRLVIFSGLKKNYIGVYEDGGLDIKGMIGKKRNTPQFIKDLFFELSSLLSKLENVRDIGKTINAIKQLAKDSYLKLKRKEYTLDQLAFRVVLSKHPNDYVKTTPQHVKAARLLMKYGVNLGLGDIVSYVKVKGGEGVKPVQLARIDEIDEEKYMNYLETTFRQVLRALGIDFDEIVGSQHMDKFLV